MVVTDENNNGYLLKSEILGSMQRNRSDNNILCNYQANIAIAKKLDAP